MAKQARIVDFQEARASSSGRASSSRASSRRRGSSAVKGASRSTSSSGTSRSRGSGTQTRRAAQAGAKATSSTRQQQARTRSSSQSRSSKRTTGSSARADARSTRNARAAKAPGAQRTAAAERTAPRFQLPAIDLSFLSAAFQRIVPRSRVKRVLLATAVFLVAATWLLYPAARDYYTAVREQERTIAAFDMARQRNEVLEQDVAALSTQAGVEDRMREQYGWVKQGENAVTVTGLNDDASVPTHIADLPAVNSVKAPDTWYSPVLDRLFGYEG